MEEAKFTPAPWKVWGDWAIKDCTKAENLIAQFEDGNFANAHLIAAAPEMYAMLERTASIIKMAEETDYQCYGAEMREDVAAINELLAKARGE